MSSQLDQLFQIKLGSYPILDSIYLYYLIPLSMIGLILNLISFITFVNINFKKKILRHYLIIYSLDGIIGCSFAIWYCLSRLSGKYESLLTYSMFLIRCKLIGIGIASFFHANLLDCIILCERISYFNSKFNRILKYNPYLMSFFLLIFVNFVNLPQYLINDMREKSEFDQARLNLTILQTFSYCKRNQFFYSTIGNIILYLVIAIRDILTLIVESIAVVYSFVAFRAHLNKMIALNVKTKRISLRVGENNQVKMKIFCKVEKFNAKLIKMTMLLSLISILSHLGLIVIYVSYSSDSSLNTLWSHLSTLLTVVFIVLKFATNFFFFYSFKKKFSRFILFALVLIRNFLKKY
jgi:hypothetical protein